jgi:hypothetical protein
MIMASAHNMTRESTVTRKSAGLERRPLPPSMIVRKSNGPDTSGANALRQRLGNQGIQRLMGEMPGHANGAALLRSLSIAAKDSEGASPIMQTKCAACESGGGACAECASEEKRKLTTPAARRQPGEQKSKEKKGGPGTKPNAPERKKEEPVKCPKETITMSGAKCGPQYGAVATYCYEGAVDWWFKESIKNGPGSLCQPGNVDQTTTPFQSHDPCIDDEIFNFNGPPKKVAPCTHTTFQTIFMGPTKDKVEQCQYKHAQVIEVAAADAKLGKGKVTTTVGGQPTECAWTS